jgi:hypothetical protein
VVVSVSAVEELIMRHGSALQVLLQIGGGAEFDRLSGDVVDALFDAAGVGGVFDRCTETGEGAGTV